MTRTEAAAVDSTGAQLGDAAARAAVKGAQQYLAVRGLTVATDKLAEAISRHSKAMIQTALADAKEAFDCGMTQVGIATFTATMVQAGINAAKEVTA